MSISAKTWNKDTEDLYDFETKDVILREFKVLKEDRNQYLISQSNILKFTSLDDKITMIKDINEVKKKLLEKSNGECGNIKVIGEINYRSKFRIYNLIIKIKMVNFIYTIHLIPKNCRNCFYY